MSRSSDAGTSGTSGCGDSPGAGSTRPDRWTSVPASCSTATQLPPAPTAGPSMTTVLVARTDTCTEKESPTYTSDDGSVIVRSNRPTSARYVLVAPAWFTVTPDGLWPYAAADGAPTATTAHSARAPRSRRWEEVEQPEQRGMGRQDMLSSVGLVFARQRSTGRATTDLIA